MISKRLCVLVISMALITCAVSAPEAFAAETSAVVNNKIAAADSVTDPMTKSYVYNNYAVSGTNSFSTSITLTNADKYGKAFYYNNSGTAVNLTVSKVDSITIQPYKSGSIEWKKGLLNSTYEVSLHCASANLNGSFSLAKSSRSFS
jgi:uncharacterized protein YcfL